MWKYHEAAAKVIFQMVLAAVLFFAGLLIIADGVQLMLDVAPQSEPQDRAR